VQSVDDIDVKVISQTQTVPAWTTATQRHCRVSTYSIACIRGVRRMNRVNERWARLVLGWVTVFGRVWPTISVCNQPTRSTQPWQVTLCDATQHVSSRVAREFVLLLSGLVFFPCQAKRLAWGNVSEMIYFVSSGT